LVTDSDITLNPAPVSFPSAGMAVHLGELILEEASSNLVVAVITVSAMAALSGPHPVRNSRPAL